MALVLKGTIRDLLGFGLDSGYGYGYGYGDGSGDGSVHPKYIEPILEFLEFKGIRVRPSEMKNLGYHHVDDVGTKRLILEFFPKAQFKLLNGNEFVFGG